MLAVIVNINSSNNSEDNGSFICMATITPLNFGM